MDNIGSIYQEYLQEKVVKDFLYDGVIPNKSQIDEKLESFEDTNPGFNSPFTQPEVYELAELERSSAAKTNSTFSYLYDDLAVLYLALADQASTVTQTFDAVASELSLIKKKTGELENRVANLLFLAPDSEGSLDFVSDSFTDKSKVDEPRSSVLVDTSTGKVTLAANTFSRVNLALTDSDVQFNVITRDEFLSEELAPSSSLLNAFADTDNIWAHRVRMRRGVGAVTAELILRVPTANTEVNRVTITPSASDEGNIATVSVQYSNDGLNWLNVIGENNARLIGDTSLNFTSVKASYWKFIFNKAGYDEYSQDSYLYEFGAKLIQLYGVAYAHQDGLLTGTLIGNALIPASNKSFNKVSLSACEVLPVGCTIQYSIAALNAAELSSYESGTLDFDDLPFIAVDPQERKNKTNQSFIDYSKIDPEDGHEDVYGVDDSINFRYKNRFNLALDYVVAGSVVKDQMKVLRNLGDNMVTDTILNQDTGWTTDGNYYHTELYIAPAAGITINFGDTTAILNGVSITGRVNIPQGYHKFSTNKVNWRRINPAEIGVVATPDPLYPYNHKYLIEGISDTLYGSDLTLTIGSTAKKLIVDPNSVYIGVDLHWSKTLEEVSIFDFTSNIDDSNYNVFAITKDAAGTERIVVKHTDEPGLMVDENFAIITRSVNGALQKAVILKAIFNSLDSKLTPILDEYVIKLGY